MERKGTILMQKYELGKLLGQGAFAKVHHARNIHTGESFALKIIDKEKVNKVGLIEQIKREIAIMRLVRHPNVVQLYEVMASKTKIYLAMEYVKGGELFRKISKGKLKESVARKYFQQLIAAVDFCHSRGVYHRDLKPENLLLDESGRLKVTDFGLSALLETKGRDGLLHTTCGTPAYVAPEVITNKGYDGEKADIWSCGVILFVLLAGYLPFRDKNLMEMYRRISRSQFKCPKWFSNDVKQLLTEILDPNPVTRMTLAKLRENPWFKKDLSKNIEIVSTIPNYDSDFLDNTPRSILDVNDLDLEGDSCLVEKTKSCPMKLTTLNAFDIISLSRGFDLSGLFENDTSKKSYARFITQESASSIVSKFETLARNESFSMKKKDGTMSLQCSKQGRKGKLSIDAEIFEVTPSFHVVEVKKTAGDTIEYKKFCDQELRPSLKDIVWTWEGDQQLQQQQV